MMDKEKVEALYEFGKDIVIEARDGVLDNLKDFLKGNAVGRVEQSILRELSKIDLNEREKSVVMLLVASQIDAMLHRLFVNFDESLEKFQITMKDTKEKSFDLVSESDGLSYGYLEFIDKFSKYKSPCDIAEEDISSNDWKLEK